MGVRRQCSTRAGGALCRPTRRNWSPSLRSKLANLDSHRRVAFASMASNTGSKSPGELEMTRSTSEVAVCCSNASVSFFSSSAVGSRVWPTRVLAFVPVERGLRLRVGLFAPLRDKVTSSAQSLVPYSGRPSQGSSLSILTEPHDELAAFHSITSSARASSGSGTFRYGPNVLPGPTRFSHRHDPLHQPRLLAPETHVHLA